ncbi:hypothetical protein CK486_11425 [Pseudomonas sp. HAR-UPW-AIA-41]|uniref:SIMPL domain-containing protein n=1 Tax=Pseudomonas sp. HAR-UPW-AIA-41 TaxID=1985301 RepID=UPI000BB31DB6|nr:SIMPL domain-containing protein [Pseudomonas sp. HAR-UPW-AIA-41]PAV47662.1 hypothetical protein CK486_11425 [Pseudomonas sp. HAR-UPW-AIA-41]
MIPSTRLYVLLFPAALLVSTAQADNLHYNQVSLRTEVSQEVPHDLMQVILYSEAQDNDPAKLAASITENLNKAIAQARQSKGVQVSLGSRHSYPVYSDNGEHISAWRERAELRLESAQFSQLSKLTGELLQQLKMGGMTFSIADSTRQASEDALIKTAVESFKARAQLTSETLGGNAYKIVNLSFNSGFQPPMPVRMAAMKGMAMNEAAPAPEIEAGSSKVTLSVDGVIEVQMP